MIDVILFVTASTLSGSLLLLLIETAGRFFETKIGPGKIYLLLKISLLYFWIPMVFLALFLAGMYTYEPNLMPHEELDGFYTLNYFTDLAMERQFVRTPLWMRSLFGIWIAGAVSIGAGRSLYKRVQLRRLLENCTKLEDGEVAEAAQKAASYFRIRKRISLYQCPQIAGPFLYGVFRPQMVVPERELAQEEWELIFLHEFTHYQNKDTFYRQLVEVILWIHWFNPLIYRFSHLFRDYGELACDEKVSRQLEKERRGEYARLLVKLAKESGQVSYAASFSNGNEKFFKRRISVIMRKEMIRKRTTAAAILAAAAAVIFCPIAAFASTWGAMAIYNEIAEKKFEETSMEEVYTPYEYEEKMNYGELLPDCCPAN